MRNRRHVSVSAAHLSVRLSMRIAERRREGEISPVYEVYGEGRRIESVEHMPCNNNINNKNNIVQLGENISGERQISYGKKRDRNSVGLILPTDWLWYHHNLHILLSFSFPADAVLLLLTYFAEHLLSSLHFSLLPLPPFHSAFSLSSSRAPSLVLLLLQPSA